MGNPFGSNKSEQKSESGFSQLPKELQQPWKQFGNQVSDILGKSNQAGMFTPMQQTADETAAFDAIRRGFAPTADSIAADVAMQTNPFDQYVIDAINREATGQNSVLQRNLAAAGQFGSNRQALGANDIDLTRLQQIGAFKQGNFNNALNNAMTVLPQARANDAQSVMGIGSFQRALDAQTRQAPVASLQALGGLMGIPGINGGTVSTQKQIQSDGWLKPVAGAASAAIAASDANLKEAIVPAGVENGYPIYEFNYIGDDRRYVGVMAQDVEKIMPEAVIIKDGYKAVDYDMIGVKFREV